MSHTFSKEDIKKFGLRRALNKLPDDTSELGDYVSEFLNMETKEERKDFNKRVDKILSVARETFTKAKVVVRLGDASNDYSSHDVYRNVATGEIEYHSAYVTAMELATLVYLKQVGRNPQMQELPTFALLLRMRNILRFDIPDGRTTFDEISFEMLDELRGNRRTAASQLMTNDYLLYMMMPQMSYHLTTLHRSFYDAIINEDVVQFGKNLDLAV